MEGYRAFTDQENRKCGIRIQSVVLEDLGRIQDTGYRIQAVVLEDLGRIQDTGYRQ